MDMTAARDHDARGYVVVGVSFTPLPRTLHLRPPYEFCDAPVPYAG
jgi:hypothetical protein